MTDDESDGPIHALPALPVALQLPGLAGDGMRLEREGGPRIDVRQASAAEGQWEQVGGQQRHQGHDFTTASDHSAPSASPMSSGRLGGSAAATPKTAVKEQQRNVHSVDDAMERLPEALARALMPFQRGGIKFCIEMAGRCMIGDDMGLGKTLQVIRTTESTPSVMATLIDLRAKL